MFRRSVGVLLVLALVALAPACRMQERSKPAGALTSETLVQRNEIPAAWGNLVGVSSVAKYPDLVQLWFQDQQGAVRLVVFNASTLELLHANLIRRN